MVLLPESWGFSYPTLVHTFMSVPTSMAKTKLQGKIAKLIQSILLGLQLQQLDRKILLSNNLCSCGVPLLVLLLQLQDCLNQE